MRAAAAQKKASAAPGGLRVIKKYPNRRLYDTEASAYVSLADVKALVMGFTPLVVQDAKTGEDLTRSILLQVILEEEGAGVPLFSEAALANMIRLYGFGMQSQAAQLFEKNAQWFMDAQAQFGRAASPLEAVQQMQAQWLSQARGVASAFGFKPPQ